MVTKVKRAGLRVRVLAALFVLMTSVEVVSAELDRESFALVGEALVEVGPFDLDVYQVRHFTRNANETLVELTYLRDVPRYLSLKGWDKGFEHIASVPDLKVAMDWVRSKTPDLKEGDRFAMLVAGSVTSLYLNSLLVAKSDSPNVARIIHSPWIGDKALDLKIRAQLLGKE